MKRHILSATLLLALGTALEAAAPPELVQLQQQYAFATAERVTSPFETGVEELNAKFLGALGTAEEEAKKAGKLPEVLAIQEDKKRIADHQPLPEKDDDKTPAALAKLRGVYRTQIKKLEEQRAAAHATLLKAYTTNLQALESTLTKADRLGEAKEVMSYREALPTDPAAPPPAATAPTPAASTPAALLSAKDGFTNSLGMKFLPVKGTDVLFCIHEVRYQDYATYAAAASDVDERWKDQSYFGYTPLENKGLHPVIRVSWEDAQKFCAWLSQKEGKTYRLPTDEEWSVAVGLGRAEKHGKGTTPAMLNGVENTEFPWGTDFPPKTQDRAGNYSDASRKAKAPQDKAQYLENYDDGFPTTAEVMKYAPNKFGLYDMGGNIWEWCEDWYDASQKDRVMRGAAFLSNGRGAMLSSNRHHAQPTHHNQDYGFRVVLALPGK